MRGIFGILLFGGILAALGTLASRRGRGAKMWKQFMKQSNNLFSRLQLNQVMRKGRRIIRNMGDRKSVV